MTNYYINYNWIGYGYISLIENEPINYDKAL